jgi:peptidoglycan glycosyltransferase
MEGATANRSPTPAARRPRTRREVEQARRRRNRLLPLAVVALGAFIFGVMAGAGNADKEAVQDFISAWTKQDFKTMHDKLSGDAQSKYPFETLASDYLNAQQTATATAIDPGSVDGPSNGIVKAHLKIRTRIFGVVEGEMDFPVKDGKISWEPSLAFPGLQSGEVLGRRLTLGPRAPILAADGTPLAEGQGDQRTSPIGDDAIDVTGETGKPDAHQAAELDSEGYPSDTDIGVSGAERAFNTTLSGTPGGQLLAVQGSHGGDEPAGTSGRVLATSQAKPGEAVKTTIDPDLQQAAVTALAGRQGGAVVLDATTGDIKALAGAAYSAPAPPGSTFKIITTTAALEAKVVKLSDTFDYVDGVNVGGREITNSNKEVCGGTFVEAFADSCNSVFAPLGPKIGSDRLVDTAEKFGFNSEPEFADDTSVAAVDPPESSIPTEIGDDLDLGVSAIGQGLVLGTPLEMATVAQTIAAGGKRSPTNMVSNPALRNGDPPVTVTTTEIAGILKNLMIGVVENGTGTAANLGRIKVAGKTGTAELGPKPKSEQPDAQPLQPGEEPPAPKQIIDAWFTCFAPAEKPKYVVATFLADAEGDGGEVAAPMARQILEAAL